MAGSASILIIDDDAAVSRTLSLILTRAGYQVSTATSGRKGLELLSHDNFDLVLTDIIMPELDGIEAIRRIRSDHPGPAHHRDVGRRPDRQGRFPAHGGSARAPIACWRSRCAASGCWSWSAA